MPSAFVTSRGNLIHQVRDAKLSKRRTSLFLIIGMILALTNPPNYFLLSNLMKSNFGFALDGTRIHSLHGDKKSRDRNKRTLSWKIFGYEFDLIYRSESKSKSNNGRSKFGTNFGIFTLDDRGVNLVSREVVGGALLNEVSLCQYNLLDEDTFCSWSGKDAYHRKYAFTLENIILI